MGTPTKNQSGKYVYVCVKTTGNRRSAIELFLEFDSTRQPAVHECRIVQDRKNADLLIFDDTNFDSKKIDGFQGKVVVFFFQRITFSLPPNCEAIGDRASLYDVVNKIAEQKFGKHDQSLSAAS